MKASELYTRQNASDGVDLQIKDANNLPLPGVTVRVRGMDSDEFLAARTARARASVDVLALPPEAQAKGAREADIVMVGSMIVAWTFDEPCTPEAIHEVLRESPLLYDQVNAACANRALFLTPRGVVSSSTQPVSSD